VVGVYKRLKLSYLPSPFPKFQHRYKLRGYLSMTLERTLLVKTIKGILRSRPKISRKRSPFVASATARILSILIARSATIIVMIACLKIVALF